MAAQDVVATKKRSEALNSIEFFSQSDEVSNDSLQVGGSLTFCSLSSQLQTLIDRLYEISGRKNPEDFLDAFRHSQRLYENMSQHQSLAESRISQLRSEEIDLQSQLDETLFVSSQDNVNDSTATTATSERELRYLNQRSPLSPFLCL
jgi:hypothetical protein